MLPATLDRHYSPTKSKSFVWRMRRNGVAMETESTYRQRAIFHVLEQRSLFKNFKPFLKTDTRYDKPENMVRQSRLDCRSRSKLGETIPSEWRFVKS